MRRFSLLLFLSTLFSAALTTAAQGTSAPLQPGTPVERSLSAGQTHSYTINLEKDQFVQLAAEQRGVDVLIRVFMPDGKLLREFDSPTGAEGTEYVEFVGETSGTYRIEVGISGEGEIPATASYEIKVVELRKATDEELQTHKNERTRKAKGLALLIETAPQLEHFRQPEARITMQLRAAQLLWPSDEKQALKLMAQAIDSVKQLVAQSADDDGENEGYQLAMKLRQQVIRALAPHDVEAALKFLQSTRQPVDVAAQYGQVDPELQLEFSLINQVIDADPKRAFELAEDTLKRSSSTLLMETLTRLAANDRNLASRLAHDMAKKVQGQDLIRNRDAAYLAGAILNAVRSTPGTVKQGGDGTENGRLLSDEEFRDLFLKIVTEVLSYSPEADRVFYTPEYDAARSLAATVRQLAPEVKTYAADRADFIDKKISELLGTVDQPGADWQRYQMAAMNEPIEAALETVPKAPQPMQDFLYQQVAARIATSGDIPRAQQIISERISNSTQRQQALYNLRQQAVTTAAEKGRLDEALRLLTKFKPGSERNGLIPQILEQIGPGVKRSLAIQYLEQAKNLVTTSARAENDEQMQTLLGIAGAFAPRDANRAFQVVAPLIGQFNELSAAAVSMNGFGQEYYADGELITSNGNPVAETANQLSDTLATLAMFDFDRAKTAADGIERVDVRLRVFLTIAERTLEIFIEPDEGGPEGYNTN